MNGLVKLIYYGKTLELIIIRNTFMNNTSLDIPVGVIGCNPRKFIADEDYSVRR